MLNQDVHARLNQAQLPDTLFKECESFLAHMQLSGIAWEEIVLALAGMDPDDLCDSWNDWHTRWTVMGRAYEEQACRGGTRDSRSSRRQRLMKAAACHHYAELMFFENPEAKFMSRRRVSRLFLNASPLHPYELRTLDILHGDVLLPAYLLHSRGAGPAPCVVLVNSLSSAKEIELEVLARAFLAQGLSVVLFDGPGQGELAGLHRLPVCFENVIESVLARVRELPEVDSQRLGICGLGLGGYLAARCAALLPGEFKACASVSGGYDHDNHARLSPLVRQGFRFAFGQPNEVAMARLAREELNLRGVPRLTIPLLAIHGQQDTLVLRESCLRLLDWARGDKDLIAYPEERHACANRSADFLPRMGRWMASALGSPWH